MLPVFLALLPGAAALAGAPEQRTLQLHHAPAAGPLRCGQVQIPQAGSKEAASGVQFSNLPNNTLVDVNIGTNLSPFPTNAGHYTILVDPIPSICRNLIARFASDARVCFLCLAVADYSGTAEFKIYNDQGVSSSLTSVTNGTSTERFKHEEVRQPVFVVQALPLLREALSNNIAIDRLKLDMQGHEFQVLKNIRPILAEAGPAKVRHIMAECFFPNGAGKQIYDIENSCDSVSQLLQSVGYTTKVGKTTAEWGDVHAYRAPATSFYPASPWA